jgi:hypothetical protein
MLENVRSNQHQVAINLSINIIRKGSIIENLSFVFPIVSIAPMSKTPKTLGLECGHRENKERIAFAEST